jgi:hypothetical protein
MAPYCSKDQWAKRKSSKTQTYDDWADYATAEDFPDANALDEALQDATNIMNDFKHINTASNITDTQHTSRLERICYNMANRMLGIEGNQAIQGGIWTYSPGDMLNSYERDFLVSLSRDKGTRLVGKVVF